MPLRIQSESRLNDILTRNFDTMTDAQIQQFVEESEKLKSSNCK